MREELVKLSNDIKKVMEAAKVLSTVTTMKMEPELEKLIGYALEHNIIRGTSDVVDLSLENPEIKDIFSSMHDRYIEQKIQGEKKKAKQAEQRYENRYAGTYNSWDEVPGYETEWNMRCPPSGVYIRNKMC